MKNDSVLGIENSSEENKVLAGFWIRFGASFLDSLFLIPLSALGFFAFIYVKDFYLYAFLTFVTFMYKPLMEGVWGATLGKMVCKIEVKDISFQKLSFSKAIIRSIPWLFVSLSGLIEHYPLFSLGDFINADSYLEVLLVQDRSRTQTIVCFFQVILIVSGMFIGFKPRRGIHDFIAGSLCVYKIRNG